MYWSGAGGPRFVRPIRWIVALLDGKVVAFNAAGVDSGSDTSGHRFLGKAKIPVRGPADYVSKLRSNFVIVHAEDRRKKIEQEIQGAGRAKKLADPRRSRPAGDGYLSERISHSVLLGNFDPAFLELPDEILVTVMRDHQKYFAVENRKGRARAAFSRRD